MLNRNKNKKIKSKLLKNGVKIKYTRIFCKITFTFNPTVILFFNYDDGNRIAMS